MFDVTCPMSGVQEYVKTIGKRQKKKDNHIKLLFQHREARCRQRPRKIRLQPENKIWLNHDTASDVFTGPDSINVRFLGCNIDYFWHLLGIAGHFGFFWRLLVTLGISSPILSHFVCDSRRIWYLFCYFDLPLFLHFAWESNSFQFTKLSFSLLTERGHPAY